MATAALKADVDAVTLDRMSAHESKTVQFLGQCLGQVTAILFCDFGLTFGDIGTARAEQRRVRGDGQAHLAPADRPQGAAAHARLRQRPRRLRDARAYTSNLLFAFDFLVFFLSECL